MSVIGNPLLLTPEGYQISRSVRLRSSASAYFNRTPASAGNRKTWTWSGWVKRGKLTSAYNYFWSVNQSSGARATVGFDTSDRLTIQTNSSGSAWDTEVTTTQVFRDTSAWYHIVFAFDTTQATSSNRVKLYVNGNQVTSFSTATYPTQNTDCPYNATLPHAIGSWSAAGHYFDGYLAEPILVDGQQLTASSFGETDAVTGVWKPKKYAGTYGTNGFYLNFSDNSSNTATTIGKDYSGNGNNWTPNNISVTSGVTYDSMLDVPTPWADGGNGRGNYCTLNPLDKTASATVTDGNLKMRVAVTGANHFAKSTMTLPADKIYFEAVAGANTGGTLVAGLGLVDVTTQTYSGVKHGVQCVNGDFLRIVNGVDTSLGGGGITAGTVIGLAYDLINGLMTIYKNGTALASNISISTTLTSVMAHAYRDVANDVGWEINFGQRPFSGTVPTGFKALNTLNLP